MMILSGGKEPGRKMQAEVFASQHIEDRGFFVSWHELESGYPTLSQRVYNLMALGRGEEPRRVSRNPIAYLFAIIFSRLTFFLLIVAYIALIAIAGVKATKEAQAAKQQAATAQSQVEEDEEYEDESISEEDTETAEGIDSEESPEAEN